MRGGKGRRHATKAPSWTELRTLQLHGQHLRPQGDQDTLSPDFWSTVLNVSIEYETLFKIKRYQMLDLFYLFFDQIFHLDQAPCNHISNRLL